LIFLRLENEINLNLFIVIIAIFTSLQVTAQDPNFHIYLAFGQSNMEGQGLIEQIDQKVNARFQVMQALDCPELARVKGAWRKAIPPLCQCYSGLGPMDYFGRTMVSELRDSITIGVINISVAGCDIRLFDKDIYRGYLDTHNEEWVLNKAEGYGANPYKHHIELAMLAQMDGVIRGILIHQGETNTGDEQWPSFVQKIYTDLLNDLSLSAEQVPILAGEVVSGEASYCSKMKCHHRSLAQRY